jgi:hypothetical protein
VKVVAVILALLLVGACSFAGAGGPRPNDPDKINCGRELVAPIVDTTAAAALLTAAIVMYTRLQDNHSEYADPAPTFFIGVPASLAAIYAFSATHGYVHAGYCRNERRRRYAGQPR